jgi:hypothetical protein
MTCHKEENALLETGRMDKTKPAQFANLSAAAQRARLLDALRSTSVTTLEARRMLDILHPAMRVLELRRQGYLIETVWARQETDAGIRHRVARYVLKGERRDA